MNARWNAETGAINFVKIFTLGAIVAAFYFSWIYLPMFLDHMAVKKAVRTACNVAYSSGEQMEPVKATIFNGWREAKVMDQEIGVDGSILTRPTPFDEQNFTIDRRDAPPSITIAVTYERKFVWPFSKKQRVKTFTYAHTEDLSSIKY